MGILFFCLNAILSGCIVKKNVAIKPIIPKPKIKIIKNEMLILK